MMHPERDWNTPLSKITGLRHSAGFLVLPTGSNDAYLGCGFTPKLLVVSTTWQNVANPSQSGPKPPRRFAHLSQ